MSNTEIEDLHRRLAEVEYALARRESELRFKEALVRDIDHRTKNTLQIAAGLLHMQGKRSSDVVRQALNEAADRLVAVATAHNRLNRHEADNRVRLDEYLTELCQAVGGAEPDMPVVQVEAEPLACRPEVAVPLGLLTSETVMNALKYAFPDARSGEIRVHLTRADRLAELVISDNGVGRDPNAADGLGSRLIRTFASQLGGDLELASIPNHGCTLRLRFDPGLRGEGERAGTPSRWD